MPEPSTIEDYSGHFKLRIQKSLHQQFSEHAKQDGISINRYCLYLLTKFDNAAHNV
ncbi:MAG: toxin-antitoxin system HicB family antitoxin [Oscillospiraceae bacterium]